VLALLAFTCFPVLAQAETVYELEQTNIPASGGGTPPTHHKNPAGSESTREAHQSAAAGAGGEADRSTDGSSKSKNGASEGTNPSTPGGGSKAQGESGKGAVGAGEALGHGSVQLGEAQSATSESGGSSPLVPILIAVAVLAAISVGAVLVRQRRGGSANGFSLKRG
jgi:cobalamin biosynthesis Mg chelatase CobN